MKYAVIAALLATASAKPTGCKKGLGVKVYSDEKCKNDAHEEHVMVEADEGKTGKCESFEAEEKDVTAVVSAKKTVEKAKKDAKIAKDKFNRNSDYDVTNAAGDTGMAPDVYKPVYADIKAAYVKKENSAKVVQDFKDANDSTKAGINAY